MRLINTKTLTLAEFFGSDIPRYAILSHTWGREEITYQEWTAWQTNRHDPVTTAKEGFTKIQGACKQARKDKLDWLWVDTNCIDKTSSSELTEAINSMYIWYRDSVVCYAFLADVPPIFEYDRDPHRHVRRSRWFTRGWTLQELLAPKRLEFYTKEWSRIGSKSGSLIRVIHETTDIDVSYLAGHTDIAMASVAKKMSWLSKRTTTRVEDMAYCMLGIFEINMPLLYGEGMRAFTRLQNEIIRDVYDHTIFCWTWNDDVPSNWVSMLAPFPTSFRDSGDYVQRKRLESLSPYSITNLGLSLNLPVIYTLARLFVVLDAGLSKFAHDKRACIPLRRPDERAMVFERVYFPTNPLSLPLFVPHKMPRYSLYALTKPTPSTLKPKTTVNFPSKFGLLLFIDPTASRFIQDIDDSGSGMPVNQPLLTREYNVGTFPPEMFDGSRNLLFIPPSELGGSLPYTLTMAITVYKADKYTLDEIYYLYFAIDRSATVRWHCYVTNKSNVRKKKWNVSFDHFNGVEEVHRYLNTRFAQIWESKTYHSKHETSDKLRLAIGKSLNIYTVDVDIRACVISGGKGVRVDLNDSEDEEGADGSDNDSNCAQAERN